MLRAIGLAEREGFEPPIRLPVCRISSAVLSTTQPPLRGSCPDIGTESAFLDKALGTGKAGEAMATRKGPIP